MIELAKTAKKIKCKMEFDVSLVTTLVTYHSAVGCALQSKIRQICISVSITL